jgi:hypothetical protein
MADWFTANAPPNPSGIIRQPMSGSMSDWLGGGMTDTGGGIVRQPTNATLPGTPTNGGNPTPVFPGVGGSGNAQMFPQGGGTTPATGGGDLRSQVVTLANQVGRPDIAANPDYWVQQIAGKGQGPGGANGPLDVGYWSDRFKTANGGVGGGASGSSAGGSIGSFLQPFTGTFTPPTGTDDPGFQFALKQGTDAIQRSGAAKGNLLTGGTLKDLASYTTGAALQDYSGAYNRALQTFGTNYDIFRNNQTDPYNKLMGVTGLGLNATNATTAAGSSYGNNLAGLGSQFGNTQQGLTTGIGNAQAAGTIGAANALTPAISTLAPAFTSLGDWFKRHNGTPVTDTGMGTPPGMRG